MFFVFVSFLQSEAAIYSQSAHSAANQNDENGLISCHFSYFLKQ